MNPSDWARIGPLFEQALDLPEEDRAVFLDQHAPDAETRQLLQELLVNLTGDPGFLAAPDAGKLAAAAAPWRPAPGEYVGPYRVERLIGQGGMGSVYEARQERPDRSVALKVMHEGLGSVRARQRFEAEAEILARLRHPGIAMIHAAGVHRAPSGQEVPFFAMEFVEEAQDLVSFARQRGLDRAARLTLFRELCAAVHHAHQKGVIHRDLKPGNVLVDPAGHVKVIDYGVARVTGGLAGSALTQDGYVLGTLQYMSPEQLRGASEDVDTRSDVYALGVLLYQLLTGDVPYDLQERSMAQIIAAICEREPVPPSARAPDVPRELDWIVMLALSKDRERRYGSAAQLSDDLGRFLAQEPVQAGPPTRRYRVSKFIARNRVLVGAAVLVLASLVYGIVASTLARIDAEEARDAEAAQTHLTNIALKRQTAVVDALDAIITGVRPDEMGRNVTLYELLERRRASLAGQSLDDLQIRAVLLQFYAEAYYSLGELSVAAELAEESLAIVDAFPEAERPERPVLRRILSTMRRVQGREAEADQLAEQAQRDAIIGISEREQAAKRERAGEPSASAAAGASQGGFDPEHDPDQASQAMDQERAVIAAYGMRDEGMRLNAQERYEEAADIYRELIALVQRSADPSHPITAIAMAEMAEIVRMFDPREAEQWARDAYDTALEHLGAESPFTAIVSMRLGNVLREAKKHEESLGVLRDTAQRMDEHFGAHHPNTLQNMYNLITTLTEMERGEEAERIARRSLELTLEHHGDEMMELEAGLRRGLAAALKCQGDLEGQIEQLETALERLESVGQGNHPAAKRIRNSLAQAQP